MKNTTQGFTLIELLIVIAIIGILAAVLIPNLLGAQKRAYDTGAQACAKSIQTAQATMQIDKQGYFTIAKSSGSSDAAPTITDGSIAGTGTGVDGVSSGCSKGNIVIATATATGSTYSVAVSDIRGTKTFTVTPSTLN